MNDRYAVFGHPIEHSKSPQIHSAFAEQTGQSIQYDKILGDKERFEEQVKAFFAQGGKGLNITVPFKERAYRLSDEKSNDAQVAQAVNTLIPLPDGRLRGENTDGIGLIQDLKNHHFRFAGKRVLLIGAGGAAKGLSMPLLSQGLSLLVVANRTPAKAHQLVNRINLNRAQACSLDELNGLNESFDLVINATSSGLSGVVPDMPETVIQPGKTWVYDLIYTKGLTCFERWGQILGAAKIMDGLGMLVEQAAQSFYLWRGVKPKTEPVIKMLRQGL